MVIIIEYRYSYFWNHYKRRKNRFAIPSCYEIKLNFAFFLFLFVASAGARRQLSPSIQSIPDRLESSDICVKREPESMYDPTSRRRHIKTEPADSPMRLVHNSGTRSSVNVLSFADFSIFDFSVKLVSCRRICRHFRAFIRGHCWQTIRPQRHVDLNCRHRRHRHHRRHHRHRHHRRHRRHHRHHRSRQRWYRWVVSVSASICWPLPSVPYSCCNAIVRYNPNCCNWRQKHRNLLPMLWQIKCMYLMPTAAKL